MEAKHSTLLNSLPPNTLYVLVRWPFFQSFKQYPWFDEEYVYYGTWDTESIIKAYFIPFARMQELYDQGDPETFLFTLIGRA